MLFESFCTVTDCSELEKLDISFNSFRNLPIDFTLGISKDTLKDENASFCHLKHSGLKLFSQCSKLKILDISENFFDDIPSDFTLGKLKYCLKKLDISESKLSLNGLYAILDCERIESLNV